MQHEPLLTSDGSWSLTHALHGEGFHAREGAWTQALWRYARECQVRLTALRLSSEGLRQFRLLDIGTGLGLNLAAAHHELRGLGLELVADSLELDPAVPRAACGLPPEQGEGAASIALVRQALSSCLDSTAHSTHMAEASADGLRLRLWLGDARTTILALPGVPTYDAVFLDPFSPRVEGELWSEAFCREVALRMQPQARLSTYAAGSAVRRALYRAGLQVGTGARVGAKREGTVASPQGPVPALEPRVLRRLQRDP